MRMIVALLALLSVAALAGAQPTGIQNAVREGDFVQVDVSVMRPVLCSPRPEISSAEPGVPPGAEVPADATSFIVVMKERGGGGCARAITIVQGQLKLRVPKGARTLVLFIPSMPSPGKDPSFERVTWDLTPAPTGKR